MCGIVGVVGNTNATDILIQGLEKLEYRGYDSAGIFVLGGAESHLVKAAVFNQCVEAPRASEDKAGI